jgi:hypothetical protein
VADDKTPEQLAAEAAASKSAADATRDQAQAIKGLNEQYGFLRTTLSNVNELTVKNFEALVQEGKITKEVQNDINELLRVEAELEEARKRGTKDLSEYNENVEIAKEIIQGHGKEVEAFVGTLKKQVAAEKKREFWIKRGQEALKGMTKTMRFAGAQNIAFSGGIMDMASQLKDIGLKFDAFEKSLQVSTGLGQQSVDVMHAQVAEGSKFGTTYKDASEAQVALNKNFNDFGLMAPAQQKALSDQVVMMNRLGVSSEASARAIDIVTHSMKGSVGSTDELLPRLDDLAQGLGLPTGQVIEDFGKLGPKMARFGKDGVKRFEDLAKKARAMGVDVEAAFNIAEAVDTFEGASDMAGKLNAQLGMQINSTELLTASHADRLGIMQREFQATGKEFDTLHHREQQAIAEMMGIDVDVAAKIFGDPQEFEKYNEKQIEASERAAKLTDMTQKLTAAGEKMMQAFAPLAIVIAGWATSMAESGILPYIGGFLILVGVLASLYKAFQAILVIHKAWQAISAASTVLAKLRIAFNVTETASNQALAASEGEKALAQKLADEQAKKGLKINKQLILGILALGAAVLLLGAGIWLAATGMATLVMAFAGLGDAVWPAVAALGLLIIPFVALMAVAAVAVYTGVLPAFALGMLALGAAALMLGAGIGLAAYGMSLLAGGIGTFADGFERMGKLKWGSVGMGIVVFASSIFILVAALVALGFAMMNPISGAAMMIGVAALSSAFLSLGQSMASISDGVSALKEAESGLRSLESIITVSTKMSTSELDNMERAMSAVADVGEATKTAEMGGFEKIANALGSMSTPSGGGSSADRTVVLQVNDTKLGEVIVSLLNDKYGMNIAR